MDNKYIYFIITFFILNSYLPMNGQLIVTEGFEASMIAGSGQGDCGCITLLDQFSDGSNDYYGRQNNGSIRANADSDYSGFIGSNYFAGEDHDSSDCNSPCTSTMCFTMDDIIVPNPSSGVFKVSLNNPKKKKARVRLFDSIGNLIWVKDFRGSEVVDFWEKEFNLPQRELYFVMAEIGDHIQTQKISIIDRK